jgi:hypothetical protein
MDSCCQFSFEKPVSCYASINPSREDESFELQNDNVSVFDLLDYTFIMHCCVLLFPGKIDGR